MDKRGAKILAASALSTVLIMLIVLVTLRFTQPDCELIVIDPAQLRLVALNDWSKEKPIRSHDKSMLIKLAAYLEFPKQPTFGLAPQPPWSNQAPAPQPFAPANNYNNNNNLNGPQPAQPQPSNLQPQVRLGPQPSTPQTGFSNQQLANSSLQTVHAANSSQRDEERRFLPLQLGDVEVKKLDDNRYRYTMALNCTVMHVVFVRRPDRVYVQSINLERLRAQGHRGKTSCEVQLPSQGAFSVEVHEGLAHYYCDQPLHYECHHKQPGQANLLLAELHIHSIEFETGSNATKTTRKSRDFLGVRSECSPLS